MANTKREKVLKWNDKQKSESNQKMPLATLIPIKRTLDFSNAVSIHHEKSHNDIKSCLRGSRMNRYQKSHQPLLKPSYGQAPEASD